MTKVLALLSVETIRRTARALLPPRKLGTFLPEEGLDLVPLKRVYVAVAWLAGQSKAHLCAVSIIRAMPENEIPPVLRGDFYW